MKLISTNGREYNIQPIDYVCYNDDTKGKSKGHLLARQLIKEIFPSEWVLEEVPARIDKKTLYVDFIIKGRQIAVEVQGLQHKEFSEFFHQTKANFRESLVRDSKKKDWCELNNFTLIELLYGEEDEWRQRLCNY